MIVLGVDPGTRHLGWGVVRREGSRTTHVAHGVIDTDTTARLADRLCEIEEVLARVVAEHRPDAAAVESLFFAKDAQAAAKLGHARGVVLLVLARAGIPIGEYAPTLVKRTVVGSGRAEKPQVARMVAALLRLAEPPRPDAADALAVALTHVAAAPHEDRVRAALASRIEAVPRARRPRFGR